MGIFAIMSGSFCAAEFWRIKDASLASALAAELVPELAPEFANIGSAQPIRQASTAIHRETPVATTARKLRNGKGITKSLYLSTRQDNFCFGWSRNFKGRAKIGSRLGIGGTCEEVRILHGTFGVGTSGLAGGARTGNAEN